MLNKSIITNSILYTVGNIVPQVLGVFLLPVFTALLSPEEYGIINYYTVIITYLLQFSIFSVNTFLLRHYFIYNNDKERKEIIGSSFLFFLIMSVIVHVIAILSIPYIFALFNISIPLKPYYILAIGSSFFDLFTVLPLICLRVKERAGLYISLSLIKVLFRYIGALISLVLLNAGLTGKMSSDLIVNFIFAIISVVIMFRYSIFKISIERVKEIFRFSTPFFLSAIMFLLVDNSDRFFLEKYISTSSLGVYSIAVVISVAYFGFISSMYRAIEPTVFRSHGNDNYLNMFNKIRKIYYSIVIFSGICGAAFVGEIIGLFANDRFYGATKMAPLLLLAAVFQAVTLLYNMVITAERKSHIILYQHIIGAVSILLSNSILIPKLGVYGAGLSKVITYFIMGLFCIIVSKKLLDNDSFNIDIKFCLLVSFASILIGSVLYIVNLTIVMEIIVKVVIILMTTLFIYLAFWRSDIGVNNEKD